MSLVILVVGAPGTGKTTLASRLVRALHASYLSIAEIALEYGAWEQYDLSHRTFYIRLDVLYDAVRREIRRRARVVLESTEPFTPWEFGVEPAVVIALRCRPSVLYQRLVWRGWPREKVLENIEAELVGVVSENSKRLYGRRRVCEIDTSSVSPAEVYLRALAAIQGRCEGSDIDWLSIDEEVEFVTRLGMSGYQGVR